MVNGMSPISRVVPIVYVVSGLLSAMVLHLPIVIDRSKVNRTRSGTWWLSGMFVALFPEGRRFESHSSRHVGILDKSFSRSCLYI